MIITVADCWRASINVEALLPFWFLVSTVSNGASATGCSDESKVRRARPKVRARRAAPSGHLVSFWGSAMWDRISERTASFMKTKRLGLITSVAAAVLIASPVLGAQKKKSSASQSRSQRMTPRIAQVTPAYQRGINSSHVDTRHYAGTKRYVATRHYSGGRYY